MQLPTTEAQPFDVQATVGAPAVCQGDHSSQQEHASEHLVCNVHTLSVLYPFTNSCMLAVQYVQNVSKAQEHTWGVDAVVERLASSP